MAPRFSWIAVGVCFIISCQSVLCKKSHPVKKEEETVSPLKKSIIGNFDLKTYSKSIAPEKCKNRKPNSECERLIHKTDNACLMNRQFMNDNCIHSCRFCSSFTEAQKRKNSRECKDRNKRCPKWARKGDCLHYVVFMMDNCRKSCEVCGEDDPSLSDKDERCPKWGRAGFCSIEKKKMKKKCPYSCTKYASRRYTVKYAKPPKRRSPRPTATPKPTKPTPRPTRPLTEDEKEDRKEALEEFAEEEETRLREKEEQRQQEDEGTVTPIQAPPVARSKRPSPVPASAFYPFSDDELNTDVPSEYERGTPSREKKKILAFMV